MIVPPFVAATARRPPLLRPSLVTALCLLGDRDHRRPRVHGPGLHLRAAAAPLRRACIQDGDGDRDLGSRVASSLGSISATGAPGGWKPADAAASERSRRGRLAHPFVFRATDAARSARRRSTSPTDCRDARCARRHRADASPSSRESRACRSRSSCPPASTPARANLPGVPRSGAGRPPTSRRRPKAWHSGPASRGIDRRAAARHSASWSPPSGLPGRRRAGSGCPPGCRRSTAVWTASATWVVAAAVAAACAGSAVTLNYVTVTSFNVTLSIASS